MIQKSRFEIVSATGVIPIHLYLSQEWSRVFHSLNSRRKMTPNDSNKAMAVIKMTMIKSQESVRLLPPAHQTLGTATWKMATISREEKTTAAVKAVAKAVLAVMKAVERVMVTAGRGGGRGGR